MLEIKADGPYTGLVPNFTIYPTLTKQLEYKPISVLADIPADDLIFGGSAHSV